MKDYESFNIMLITNNIVSFEQLSICQAFESQLGLKQDKLYARHNRSFELLITSILYEQDIFTRYSQSVPGLCL